MASAGAGADVVAACPAAVVVLMTFPRFCDGAGAGLRSSSAKLAVGVCGPSAAGARLSLRRGSDRSPAGRVEALCGAGAVARARRLSAGASGSDHDAGTAGHGGKANGGLGAYKSAGSSSGPSGGRARLLATTGARAPGWASAGAGTAGCASGKAGRGGRSADAAGASVGICDPRGGPASCGKMSIPLGARAPGTATAGPGAGACKAGMAGRGGNAAEACGAPTALGAALGVSLGNGMLPAGTSARGDTAGKPGSGGRLAAAGGGASRRGRSVGTMVGSCAPATAAGGIAWAARGASGPGPSCTSSKA